jgi:phosphatidate cytidylyltransferase
LCQSCRCNPGKVYFKNYRILKNLFIRSLSGAVYVSAIIASLFLSEWFFAAICLLFNVLALAEFQKFNSSFKKVNLWLLTGSVFFFIIFHLGFIGLIESKWIFLSVILPLIVLSASLYKKDVDIFKSLFFDLTGYIYITIPLIILNYLNINLQEQYSAVVLLVFVLIWANDTFAYLSGMMLGKHKLFERITPKKTWEGFFGGMIATILLSWFLFKFSGFESLILWLVLGAVVSAVSVFGDFVESMFKRVAGLKDSGNIIPGHGGILDRIDSLLFVFPVVFVYFKLLI